jgi:hypothetical protein
MAKQRRKSIETATYGDPEITTKRWLRRVIQQVINFWAPIMNLEAYVDQIKFYITEESDLEMAPKDGAEILVDSSIRTATMKIKRSVVQKFQGEYAGPYTPMDVVELIIVHELSHILVSPMGQYTQSTIESMKNKIALEKLFSREEENVVEHLARIWNSIKGQLTPTRKFKGKIVYLTKDPFIEEEN